MSNMIDYTYEEDYSSNINDLCNNLNNSEPNSNNLWKVYKITLNNIEKQEEFNNFGSNNKIIRKILSNDENKPDLVAMAGFSNKSFCGSTQAIIKNLSKIKDQFNSINIFCFDEVVIKRKQTDACKDRDDKIKNLLDSKIINSSNETKINFKLLDDNNYNKIFDPEIKLNEELASFIDKSIRAFIGKDKENFTIHLLGKCAGGGVAIHIFTKSDRYEALYLGVPAHPTNIQNIKDSGIDLSKKKFIFAWDKRDAYPFTWSSKSNQEASAYASTLESMSVNYIVAKFNDGEEHEKDYHEIPDQLFDLIGIK